MTRIKFSIISGVGGAAPLYRTIPGLPEPLPAALDLLPERRQGFAALVPGDMPNPVKQGRVRRYRLSPRVSGSALRDLFATEDLQFAARRVCESYKRHVDVGTLTYSGLEAEGEIITMLAKLPLLRPASPADCLATLYLDAEGKICVHDQAYSMRIQLGTEHYVEMDKDTSDTDLLDFSEQICGYYEAMEPTRFFPCPVAWLRSERINLATQEI